MDWNKINLSINNASKGFLVKFILGGFGFVTLIQTQNVKIWSDSLSPQRFRAATSTGTVLSTFSWNSYQILLIDYFIGRSNEILGCQGAGNRQLSCCFKV
jgi:hypothetical protein